MWGWMLLLEPFANTCCVSPALHNGNCRHPQEMQETAVGKETDCSGTKAFQLYCKGAEQPRDICLWPGLVA